MRKIYAAMLLGLVLCGMSSAEPRSMNETTPELNLNIFKPRAKLDEMAPNSEWAVPSVSIYDKREKLSVLRVHQGGGLGYFDKVTGKGGKLAVSDDKVWVVDGVGNRKPIDLADESQAKANREIAILMMELAEESPSAAQALQKTFGLQIPAEKEESADFQLELSHNFGNPKLARRPKQASNEKVKTVDHFKSFLLAQKNWAGTTCTDTDKGKVCTFESEKGKLVLQPTEKKAMEALLNEPSAPTKPTPESRKIAGEKAKALYDDNFARAVKEDKLLLVVLGQEDCKACDKQKKDVMIPMLTDGKGLLDDALFTPITKEENPKLFDDMTKIQTVPQIIVYAPPKAGRHGDWKRFSLTGGQSPARVTELLDRARKEQGLPTKGPEQK